MEFKSMSPFIPAQVGQMASHKPFAIILVLEGNKNMETIPAKKIEVYPEMSKKFCGATALDNSTIVSLSSCQRITDDVTSPMICQPLMVTSDH